MWITWTAAITVSAIIGHHTQMDPSGQLFVLSGGDPAAGSWNTAFTVIFLLVAVCLVASLAGQMASWRRSSGERRQQLKWLMAGLAALVAGVAIDTVSGIGTASGTVPIGTACFLAGLFAFSLCVGVAVLRYRLFDIDRVISRTLGYAIVTGLLVGVYAGVVLLATEVLRNHHSTVAVAAATLAAAALFNPLRRRVQKIVDRRFNRARYDADRIIAAFAARLQRRGRPGRGAGRPGQYRPADAGARPHLGVDPGRRTAVTQYRRVGRWAPGVNSDRTGWPRRFW